MSCISVKRIIIIIALMMMMMMIIIIIIISYNVAPKCGCYCVISGFRRRVNEVFAILARYGALICSYFEGQPLGPIFKGQALTA
jgi:hypothetical protein